MPGPASDEQAQGRPMPAPIRQRYLLVSHIPCFVDEGGGLWLDRLWGHDLQRHVPYLPRLILAAPRHALAEARGVDLMRIDVPPGCSFRFLPLPKLNSLAAALAGLPRTARILWRAVAEADVVHSGIVGWPLPLGWLANGIALVQRKALVLVVESAPWRLVAGRPAGWRQRLRAGVSEALGRWFVNRASLAFFTHPGYRQTLLTRQQVPGFVLPATWIEEADVLDGDQASSVWSIKQAEPVRLLFAGRLSAEKGVEVLLAAVEQLARQGREVQVDVIGVGPLRARCLDLASRCAPARLRLLDPLPYGERFFRLLRQYGAVLIPTLSDEQPRIVFDAYAQAVPVIAADTEGLRPHVIPGRTGWLVPSGDVEELARVMVEAQSSPALLERMGMAARELATTRTHGQMHLERWRILAEQLGAVGAGA